ncbi:MAG: FAD-binding oxidoreductase, partial [Elioraea sp.]|nr:FAD-binding oxidoreductase [Elioraea sp.]
MRRADDLASFLAALGDIPHSTDPALCAQRSRDFHWFSPILRESLRGRMAEAVVAPRTEAEVIRVARAAARHRIPLTCRGAGTGNFGQAVPLKGGAVLDLSDLKGIRALDPFRLRAAAGETLLGLDRAAQAEARAELRIHPSTRRTATLGGFIAGGHAGVGSVTWGILRDPGNILAIRIVTAEEEPRVREITGPAIETVHHAYGVNGIITEVEMPLTRAEAWVECVLAFATFADAARFGLALASADGMVKKLVSPIAAPLTRFFGPLRAACPDGAAVVLAMVAEPSLAALRDLAAEMGGTVTLEAA